MNCFVRKLNKTQSIVLIFYVILINFSVYISLLATNFVKARLLFLSLYLKMDLGNRKLRK